MFEDKYLKYIDINYYTYYRKLKEDELLPKNAPYPAFLITVFSSKVWLLIGLTLIMLIAKVTIKPTTLKLILILSISVPVILFLQWLYCYIVYYKIPLHKFNKNQVSIDIIKNEIKKEKKESKSDSRITLKNNQTLDYYLNAVRANTNPNELVELFYTFVAKIKDSKMSGQKLYRYTNIYVKELSVIIVNLEKSKDEALYKETLNILKGLMTSLDNEENDFVNENKTALDTLKRFMVEKGDLS